MAKNRVQMVQTIFESNKKWRFYHFWHAITHILLDLGLSLDVLEARRVPAGLKFGLGPIGLCNITNISGSGSFGLEKSQNHRVRAPSGLKISPKARRAFGLGQARPITTVYITILESIHFLFSNK